MCAIIFDCLFLHNGNNLTELFLISLRGGCERVYVPNMILCRVRVFPTFSFLLKGIESLSWMFLETFERSKKGGGGVVRECLLRLFGATLLDGETCSVESFRFDEVDSLVDSRRSLVVILVMVTPFGTFGRLERRVRLQIQVQILDIVQLTASANDPRALNEIVDL